MEITLTPQSSRSELTSKFGRLGNFVNNDYIEDLDKKQFLLQINQ
jgi:hypothetical protein